MKTFRAFVAHYNIDAGAVVMNEIDIEAKDMFDAMNIAAKRIAKLPYIAGRSYNWRIIEQTVEEEE